MCAHGFSGLTLIELMDNHMSSFDFGNKPFSSIDAYQLKNKTISWKGTCSKILLPIF